MDMRERERVPRAESGNIRHSSHARCFGTVPVLPAPKPEPESGADDIVNNDNLIDLYRGAANSSLEGGRM